MFKAYKWKLSAMRNQKWFLELVDENQDIWTETRNELKSGDYVDIV